MEIRRRSASLLGAALGLLVPSVAFAAEPTQAEKSLAESLFQEGKQLMTEGRLDAACTKLTESQKLDPGAGTLTALGLCHRSAGKTATAWSEFKEVLSLARRDGRKDREQVALDNIRELEPVLSHLRVTVEPAADAQHVEIRLDDLVLPQAVYNQAIPVDPGTRRILVSASGKKTFETSVNVGPEHDEKSVLIRPLDADANAAVAMRDRTDVTPTSVTTSSGPNTQKLLGYGLVGLGVVGLGVGSVFGLRAISKNEDSDKLCPTSLCTNPDGVTASADAQSAATASTIGFVVAAAALTGGVILVITSSSRRASPPLSATAVNVRTKRGATFFPTPFGLAGTF